MQTDSYNQEERGKRPIFLLVLCILTFVSTGFSLITNVSGLSAGPLTEDEILDRKAEIAEQIIEMESVGMGNSWIELMEKAGRMEILLNNQYYAVVSVNILLALIGLFGAIWMFRGRKIGFHMYIIYSLFSVGSLYLFMAPSDVPSVAVILSLVLSGVFILMYSRNLKWLR